MSSSVTTFTQSDFGRTLTSNGDGSDHAWGGVQLVIGDAVRGRTIYGRYPALEINGRGGRGRRALHPERVVRPVRRDAREVVRRAGRAAADDRAAHRQLRERDLGFLL